MGWHNQIAALRRWLVLNRVTVASGMLVAAVVATAWWVCSGSPGLSSVPAWWHMPMNKGSADMIVLACAAAAFPWLVGATFRAASNNQLGRVISYVVVISLTLQLATGLIFRHQTGGWTDRFLHSGHRVYTFVGKNVVDAVETLRNYEQIVKTNRLSLFARSKPPGTVAVYLIIDRLADLPAVQFLVSPLTALLNSDFRVPAGDEPLYALTIVLFTLWSALTAVPLVLIARRLQRHRPPVDCVNPAILFVTVPSINLITLHLDGTLFTLMTSIALWLAVSSVAVPGDGHLLRVLGLSAGSGVVVMAAIYCSYGLLPIAVISLAAMVAYWLERYAWGSNTRSETRTLLVATAGFAAGMLCVFVVLVGLLNWHPIDGYARSIQHHSWWRRGTPVIWKHGMAAFEFAYFGGLPLFATFAVATLAAVGLLVRAAVSFARRQQLPPGVTLATVTVGATATLVALSLSVGTPEASRLWQFLLPYICLGTGALLPHRPAALLVAGQTLLCLCLKNYQAW